MGESDSESSAEGQGEQRGQSADLAVALALRRASAVTGNTTCGEDSLASTHNPNQVNQWTKDVHYALANRKLDEGSTPAEAGGVHRLGSARLFHRGARQERVSRIGSDKPAFGEFQQRVKMRSGDSPSDLTVWMGVTQGQQPTQQPVATIRRRVPSANSVGFQDKQKH